MKTIYSLNYSHLTNAQHFNFMDFVKAALTLYALVGGTYNKYIVRFLAAFEAEDEAYQKYDRKTLSGRIAKQNSDRILKFRLLRDVIEVFFKTADEEKRLAAERLLGAIDLYGGGVKIPTLGMDALTGVLTNLIEDFEFKYPADLQLLGIEGQVANLKAENEKFKELISQRTQEDSEIGKEAMALARAESDRTLRMLITAINLDVEMGDADPAIEPFIAYMNTEIDRYRILIGQGVAGSGSSGSAEEGEEGVVMKSATFIFKNGTEVKLWFEVGAPIEAPANTPGYKWDPEIPEEMPKRGKTFREVPIVQEEATAIFHFFDHREEEIRQVVGTILHAPQNTEGYRWDPEVPATMPAEDTNYYEQLIDGSGSSGSGSGSGTGSGSGGSTAPTYTLTFMNEGSVYTTQQYEVGATITAPEPPYGYYWVYVPQTMPDHDVTVNSEIDPNIL